MPNMRLDEYRISISGDLSDKEFDEVDSALDDIRETIEEEAKVIFASKIPARFKDRVKLNFDW